MDIVLLGYGFESPLSAGIAGIGDLVGHPESCSSSVWSRSGPGDDSTSGSLGVIGALVGHLWSGFSPSLPLPEFGFDMVLFGYGIESPLSGANGDLVGHM